jgi:hypothetical protein
MKQKPLPATLGILRWLSDVRKNKAVTGDESPGFTDIGEMLLAFVTPLDALEQMTDKELERVTNQFVNDLTGEDFAALQEHAQAELGKFIATAVTPKKPHPSTSSPTLIQRIKRAWLVLLGG